MTEKLLSFEGEEVSCRILGLFVDQVEKRGFDPSILTEGAYVTPDQLRDRQQRISWATFRTVLTNSAKVWSDAELIELGGILVKSRPLRFFTRLTRLFYTAEDVYKMICEVTRSDGYLDFTCIDNSFRRLGPHHVRIDVTLHPGYRLSREFFVVTQGTFAALSELVGLPSAEVERSELSNGCCYDIRVPSGGGLLRWLRTLVTWPFMAVRTARELQQANKLLYLHAGELQTEIAERKRIEEALREREEQYRRLVESSPYSICAINGAGEIESINAAGRSMFDLADEEEIHGRPFLDFVDATNSRYVEQLLGHGHQGGHPEFHFKAVNGRLLQTILVTMGDADEPPMSLMGMTLDVTERERAQEEMRSYTRDLALLNELMVESADAANVDELFTRVVSFVCDRLSFRSGAVYLLVDAGHLAELSYPPPPGGGLDRLLPGQDAPFDELFMQGKALSSQDVPRLLTSEEKADGDVLAAMVPILWGPKVIGAFRFASHGDHTSAVGDRLRILSLIGQQLGTFIVRLQAEEERKALILELEEQHAELERFTYTVSHDLKNPLFTINGYLGFLKRHAEAGNVERIVTDLGPIQSAVTQMQQLLDELLDLSRVGRVANTPQRISLAELVEDAVGLLAGQVDQQGVEVLISRQLPVVEGDRPRFLEVFQNLIGNAVKFMGEQSAPRIEIGVTERDGETLCYVRDNGMGIEARYQEKVFSLFDQLDISCEGTGIGLALVKRITEEHGGKVWVESAGLGMGSTFYVHLPERISRLRPRPGGTS
jgi:PAS domain S-box-containing protein